MACIKGCFRFGTGIRCWSFESGRAYRLLVYNLLVPLGCLFRWGCSFQWGRDMRSVVWAWRQWSVAVVLLLSAGCGPSGPEIAYVTGKVTMDGKPLANASVVFIPENGRPAGAATDADGNYVLNFAQGRRGAIPGKNTIRIMTQRDPTPGENGTAIPGSKETVPAKYNTNSTLEFVVEPKKKNVANFDLQSGDAG